MRLINLKDQGYKDYAVNETGQVWSIKSERFLKPMQGKDGYLRISLKGEKKLVHRLILQAFEPKDNPDNFQVNHIDGCKNNNQKYNLEWCTSKENCIHAVRTGLTSKSVQDEDTIHGICRLLEDGWRNKDVADVFGVSRQYIGDIKSGHTAKYISDEYNVNVRKRQRYNPTLIIKICEYLEEGVMTYSEISEKLAVPIQYVRCIKARTINNKISKDYIW